MLMFGIIFSSPTVDHEVRWCMLKLSELIYRPLEESLPKISIHLPPTPVLETAPNSPFGRVPLQLAIKPEMSRRASKMSAPPVPTPTSSTLPKLKLTSARKESVDSPVAIPPG